MMPVSSTTTTLFPVPRFENEAFFITESQHFHHCHLLAIFSIPITILRILAQPLRRSIITRWELYRFDRPSVCLAIYSCVRGVYCRCSWAIRPAIFSSRKASKRPMSSKIKAAAKRKKLIDHFAVVTSDGTAEPTLVHRWPPTDAHAPYELPPVRLL